MQVNSQVIETIINATRLNGGATLSIEGDEPAQRYVFALLGSEQYINDGSNVAHDIELFIQANAVALQRSGAYVGTWINDGQICLDVSRTSDNFEDSVYWGIMNRQQAIYDRLTATVINLPQGQFMHREYQNQAANRQIAQNFVGRYNAGTNE